MPQPDPTNIVGRRVAAFVIDLLLAWIVAGLLFFAFADKVPGYLDFSDASGAHTEVTFGNTQYVVHGGTFWLWAGLVAFVVVDIAVILEGLTGATPGKAILGIRVVREDGQWPGMLKAFLRLVGWIVDGFFCYLVGFVVALTSRRHQRVGDLMASTFVVRLADAGRQVPAAAVPVAVAVPPGVAAPAVSPPPAPSPGGTDAFGRPAGPAAPAAPAASSGPAADWYPDPTGEARLRYWDGSAWTSNTAP